MKNFERAISPSRRIFSGHVGTQSRNERTLGVLPSRVLGSALFTIIVVAVVLAVKG